MTEVLLSAAEGATTPIHPVSEAALDGALAGQPPGVARHAALAGFKAKAGQVLVAPGEAGGGGLRGPGGGVGAGRHGPAGAAGEAAGRRLPLRRAGGRGCARSRGARLGAGR